MSASRATVEAFYAAINERRMKDAIGWLAGDVRWRRPPDMPIAGTVEGSERVRRMWLAFTGSLERFEIAATGFEAGEESLLAIVTMRGTAADGRGDFEFGGCQVFRFDEGLIAEVHEFRSLDQGRALLSG